MNSNSKGSGRKFRSLRGRRDRRSEKINGEVSV